MTRKRFELGIFAFLDLAGEPAGVTERTELQTRPGVNDFAVWLQGSSGEPFTLESVVDVSTHAAALELMALYRAAVGSMLRLTWASVDFGTVAVLAVEQVSARAIVSGVGGLTVNPGAVLRARWTLAVKVGG